MSRRSIAGVVMVLGMLLFASVARANTANIFRPQHQPADAASGWQAGPCITDEPICSVETPGQFYNQAGGHPPIDFEQFIVQHSIVVPNEVEPLTEPLGGRIPRDIKVDLPPGMSFNPDASQKCPFLVFQRSQCPPGTVVGKVQVNLVTGRQWLSFRKGERFGSAIALTDLYNLEPGPGEPARLGFFAAGLIPIVMRTEVSWESDFHESVLLEHLPAYESFLFGGAPAPVVIHSARLDTFGSGAHDPSFATNPTTCFNPDEPQFTHLYSSWVRADSYEEPDLSFPRGSTPVESGLPAGVHPEGCAAVPFDPSIEVDPGTSEVDGPASPTVTAKLPVQGPLSIIAESHLRTISVTLPKGMSLNPAGSVGLVACPAIAFPKGERLENNGCPANSLLGTARIKTPVLSEPLEGNVYLGEPKSTDPASGEEFRILVEAKSLERGVVVRLIGNVKADPATGQLTAKFDEQEVSPIFGALPHGLPQLPVESVTLRFDSSHRVFTSPPTCSVSTTTSVMEPWSTPASTREPTSQFTLSSALGASTCPKTLGQRAFTPVSTASSASEKAGAFSPFRLRIERSQGQQEVKRLDVALPKGLIGKLAGIPYCSEEAIAKAPKRSAAAEQASPSCPAASLIGTTSTEAGTGGEPLKLPGKVYLAGPYKGAPISLAAITPATSGPFDLGNVVIRVALNIDPLTTQITAASDVIPDVYGGVKLDIGAVDLNLDRSGFTVNPTNCSAQATTGAIYGGGADPTNPAVYTSYPLNTPFQPTGCAALGFEPTLITELSGSTRRHSYPRLTTTLVARPGDANIAKVALTLPHAFFVAQEHIATVCTRPQLASQTCPASAVYGEAEAKSPLLDGALSGPVYLVPGGHPLPDLVADLHGQVHIQLHGVISSERGKIKAEFDSTPDVPLKEFVLKMAGGAKGLIVNSTNICKGRQLAELDIEAQSGKHLKNSKYKLNVANCRKPKHRKHRKHRKHKRHQTHKAH